ncbi:MAG: dUTP diphosphatase [Myxococcales bacterium]|nr:dUTP diphosphatase [Myxococcales bacterium]
METPRLRVKVLEHAEGLGLPSYASGGAAGLDLVAAVAATVVLAPGARCAVPTGLVLGLPPGHEGQVRARSGRALREGLAVLNGPGTIDEDYRGELQVLLVNLGQAPIAIARGERIAQLVIAPVVRVAVEAVAALDDTPRGAQGFGSTGR